MVLADKKATNFQVQESMLLCRRLTSVSEWKSWLFQESVWGESNASWQWIVSIDSTATNHFLFTGPFACLFLRFFCVWGSVRTHPYILLEQRKSIQDEDWYNSHIFSDGPEWTANGRKNLNLIGSNWLFQAMATIAVPGRSMFMLTDETKTLTSRMFYTNKQKIHCCVDLRPKVLSQELRYDLLFSESIESIAQQYQCEISWKEMEL